MLRFARKQQKSVNQLSFNEKNGGGGGLVAKLCLTLETHGLKPTRLLCQSDSPGKNTGVGCHFLLQGIFLTQESNPGPLHCRQILYHKIIIIIYIYIFLKEIWTFDPNSSNFSSPSPAPVILSLFSFSMSFFCFHVMQLVLNKNMI